MSKLSITMFPALHGDSFLLSTEDGLNILVDTGYKSTYEDHIKKKLISLNANNKCLDYLIITHIDTDHIAGALSLLEENNISNMIEIKNIWHNSYRHIQDRELQKRALVLKEQRILNQITAIGYGKEQDYGTNHQRNISAKEGSTLASLIANGNYSWNHQFNNRAICVENGASIDISDTVKLVILSPNKSKLDKLHKSWKKDLRKLGVSRASLDNAYFDDSFEFIVSQSKNKEIDIKKNISFKDTDLFTLLDEPFEEDSKSANGSSISFVLEYDDIRVLFLGDAHPSLIESELKKHYKEEVIWFDAIKIAHHGSKKNTSPSLLTMIDSDSYFISTNGKGRANHPDLVTLARIVCRPTDINRKIIFNYANDAFNTLNDNELKERFKYNVHVANTDEHFKFPKG